MLATTVSPRSTRSLRSRSESDQGRDFAVGSRLFARLFMIFSFAVSFALSSASQELTSQITIA
jgi:hypothetical protein